MAWEDLIMMEERTSIAGASRKGITTSDILFGREHGVTCPDFGASLPAQCASFPDFIVQKCILDDGAP
jgi:hypothetical protein